MFKRLLADLPFSPGLIRQVSSYRNKLRHETRLRALGLVLLILALSVQLFTMSYAPQFLVSKVSNNCIYNPAQASCSNQAASTNKTLPLLVLGLVTSISAYLYIRSRLISRELEVVRQQYINSASS
jgi:hypothetical protein